MKASTVLRTAHGRARGNATRPTGPLCDGCHSVNYNPQTKQPTEWNVGCEECHGPGSTHSHAFTFIPPSSTDSLKVPNPGTTCHKDKTTKWASDALKTWPEFSPWRVAN